MTIVVVLTLAATAFLLIGGAPYLLVSERVTTGSPRLALLAWYSVFLGGLACIVASLTITISAIMAMAGAPSSSNSWLIPTSLVLLGWVGLAGVGALVALVMATAEPLADAERRLHAQFTLLSAASDCRNLYMHGVRVTIVPSALPVALCTPGADGGVLVSSRLESELSRGQFRAIVEHERTHLVQRHGRISQLAQLNRMCLPMIPGARRLEETTRLLVELIADDAAARRVGAVHTANALLKVGELLGDDSMLLRARRVAARPPRGSVGAARARRYAALVDI
ncbi:MULTISPECIES: M56 family metallopeptidase [unclassified Cryobacterium]|uniref:M56 family metallopeptidase n=1 Tax=unclassified Cryobacterium TaxID=2649013 RepID=UPI00106CB833|nr:MULTISPECIES: M56 family metallopeptidase [unclassified Cryobacterium]TFC57497.1 M56 family peptidase [Cryobacterium sp. TMB1-7]TFC90020.1 M56 family peptidase [Cryobacterium sp. TMT4-31]